MFINVTGMSAFTGAGPLHPSCDGTVVGTTVLRYPIQRLSIQRCGCRGWLAFQFWASRQRRSVSPPPSRCKQTLQYKAVNFKADLSFLSPFASPKVAVSAFVPPHLFKLSPSWWDSSSVHSSRTFTLAWMLECLKTGPGRGGAFLATDIPLSEHSLAVPVYFCLDSLPGIWHRLWTPFWNMG